MESEKKIISYTLYGNNARYTLPLLENSKIALNLYSGWKIFVYHDRSVENRYLDKLRYNGVFTINIDESEFKSVPPKMWRFLAILKTESDCVIFRDSDSLLTERERNLVKIWEGSEKIVHIIRDHPLHIAPILAGMFGIKKKAYCILQDLMALYPIEIKRRVHDYDQVFLGDYFYPRIKDVALIHASFFKYRNEKVDVIDPVENGYDYVGSVYYGDNQKIEQERQILLTSKFVNGIPYSLAKFLRYRVRPVIYSSALFNYVYKIGTL